MKQSLRWIAFLLIFSSLAASLKDGQEEAKLNEIATEGSKILRENGELMKLMGMEEVCDKEDEECLRRRIMAEAQLDYIYTQHHRH